MDHPDTTIPTHIWSRDGSLRGDVRGSRRCQLEGCLGICYLVVWPDGKRTWPCTKGMVSRPDGDEQIG